MFLDTHFQQFSLLWPERGSVAHCNESRLKCFKSFSKAKVELQEPCADDDAKYIYCQVTRQLLGMLDGNKLCANVRGGVTMPLAVCPNMLAKGRTSSGAILIKISNPFMAISFKRHRRYAIFCERALRVLQWSK